LLRVKKHILEVTVCLFAALFVCFAANSDEIPKLPANGISSVELSQYFLNRSDPNRKNTSRQVARLWQEYKERFGGSSNRVPDFYAGSWELLGNPGSDGRATTFSVGHANDDVVYFATESGGLWKTADGGDTWSPLLDDQCSLSVGAIAVDPLDNERVFVGTGEVHPLYPGNISCGILVSDDGGQTWNRYADQPFEISGAIQPFLKIVATVIGQGQSASTVVFAVNKAGIFRSENGGQTWTEVLDGFGDDLVVDPQNGSVLYAAIGDPDGSQENGVYKSTDAGITWTRLNLNLPYDPGRTKLAKSNGQQVTLFAAVHDIANSRLGGLLKSTDAGNSWTALAANGVTCTTDCDLYPALAVSPTDPTVIFYSSNGLQRSTDGGENFSTPILLGEKHYVDFDSQNTNKIYRTAGRYMAASADNGGTWNGLGTSTDTWPQVSRYNPGLATSSTNSNLATVGEVPRSLRIYEGNNSWNRGSINACGAGFSAIDQGNDTILYTTCRWMLPNPSYKRFFMKNSNGGNDNYYFVKINGLDTQDKALDIPPMHISSTFPNRLYFGTYRLYRSSDRAENWSAISGDLTGGGTNSGISYIAEAMSDSNVIYVTSNTGKVFYTGDGGGTWIDRSSGLPGHAISSIAVHPANADIAYVTFLGFDAEKVYKTTDAGMSWVDISANLTSAPVNKIVIDPSDPQHLIVGTDYGVYRTINDGVSWLDFNHGLPKTVIMDVVYQPATDSLWAATHGRGIYRASSDVNSPRMEVVGEDYEKYHGLGEFIYDGRNYTIRNDGLGPMNWSVSSSETWLDISETSGSLDPGDSTVITVLLPLLTANELGAGFHNAVVNFTNSSNDAGTTQTTILRMLQFLPAKQAGWRAPIRMQVTRMVRDAILGVGTQVADLSGGNGLHLSQGRSVLQLITPVRPALTLTLWIP